MKVRIQADNLTELVGGGLLIAGIAVVVGLGAALLAAAFVAIMLAEFSWSGKVWHVPLPTRSSFSLKAHKDRKHERLVKKQLAETPSLGDAQ